MAPVRAVDSMVSTELDRILGRWQWPVIALIIAINPFDHER